MRWTQLRLSLLAIGFAALFVGMVSSRALISIGMILMVASGLLNPTIGKDLGKWLRQPVWWAWSGVLIVYLLSGWNSSDSGIWWTRTQEKIPFLVLPWALYTAPAMSDRFYKTLLSLFVGIATLSAVVVGVNFLLEYQEVVEQYLHAKTIETPFSHIRYSLLLVVATISAAWLYGEKWYIRWSAERYIYGVLAIFLFLFLHVLSVRSGLLAMYAVIGFLVLRTAILHRRWKQAGILMLIVITVPVLAYLLVPTFHNKVTYTLKDLRLSGTEEGYNFSDSRRIHSYIAAWHIIRTHPVAGVGIGDLQESVNVWYADYLPDMPENLRLMPHNQWLYTAAGAGLVGLCLLLLSLLWPWWASGVGWHMPFGAIQVAMWTSFLAEHTLEVQLGVAIFLPLLLLTLRMAQDTTASQTAA